MSDKDRIEELERQLATYRRVAQENSGKDCDLMVLADQITELRGTVSVLKDNREGLVCGDCDGSGWLYNRVDGKHPCTCMTEAEPYQLLKQQLTESQNLVSTLLHQLNQNKNNTGFIEITNAWKQGAPKILLNPALIKYVHSLNRNDTYYENGLAYIEMQSSDPEGYGIWIRESYDEVKRMLNYV